MNKKEIERMIALTDDRYIEELYTEKLGGRKRRPALWITAAAAAIVLAVGTGAAVLNSSDSGIVTDLQTVTDETETEFTDFIPATSNTSENDTDKDDNYPTTENYKKYFKDVEVTTFIDYTLDAGGEKQELIFPKYSSEFLPFESEFDDRRAVLYYDGKGRLINAALELNCSYVSRNYRMSIIISEYGKVYPGYKFEEIKPEKLDGVDIYGYTLGEAGGGYKNLCAYFVVKNEYSNAVGYTLNFSGFTYEEAMNVIDSIIEEGINIIDIAYQGCPPDAEPYASYFRQVDTSERISDEISLDICGSYYKYDEEYAKKVLKDCFDISRFPNASAYMHCDENGRQVNGDINLLDSFDTDPNAPFCSIRFSMDHEKFNYYPRKDPKELYGIQLYGVEEMRQGDTEKALYLDFNNGGISYSLCFNRMSYEDAIGIAAGIIKNGLSADDFNPEAAESSMKTEKIDADRLAELNSRSLFEGYIPTAESIGNMKLFGNNGTNSSGAIGTAGKGRYVTERKKANDYTYESFSLYFTYEADKKSETESDSKFISLNYFSDDKQLEQTDDKRPRAILDYFTKDALETFVKFDIDGELVRYEFKVTTGNNFYINIQANCTPDEMWQCLCLIEPKLADKEHTEGMEISAEEANEKNKFKEHIPRSASIDGLTADKAVKYYPVTIGDTVIIDGVTSHGGFGMDYEFKGENGFISLKYGDYNISVGDVELPLKAIGESKLTREMLEKHFEQPSEHEGNRKYSYMWVQFYSGSWVIINADCAPETLWKCLGEMSVYAKEPDGNTVYYNGMAYNKSDLSEETLKWLEGYNSMSYPEQLTVSYMPYDLISAQKNN